MRLRNVKNKKEIISNCEYIVNNPKEHINNWHELFNNDNPIYIEIGMGKGKFIVDNAIKYPNVNFIGIEKFDSILALAIKTITPNLSNLKLIRMDANLINEVFNKEIDKIYLNFSDPWPKARHNRRRLTSNDFLIKYDNIFKGDKLIEMKTDNQSLFEYSIESLSEYGYKLFSISLNLHNSEVLNNITTEYEEKFIKKNMIIYKLNAIKEINR